MEESSWISIAGSLAWPLTALLVVGAFYKYLAAIFKAVVERLAQGAELKTPWIVISAAPSRLETPRRDEPVTLDHVTLMHTSWRYPKKDAEFGHRMYCFHAVLQAADDVLERIEEVKYTLDSSYLNSRRVVRDRGSRFKLKELAWGESLLKAEVRVINQEQPLHLSRYINLSEQGPRI